MAFSTFCTNKGCGKQMEPYLDIKTDKVYCSQCDQEINTITHFAKVQMKALKQFKQKQPVAFGVKCQNCSKEARPKVANDDIICPFCNKPHTHLSEPFKIMLKDKLKNVSKDD